MWARIWILVIKELQQLWRSPQSRQLLIMPVLMQLLVFPFAMTLEVKNSTLGIYNEDRGAASVELIQRLSAASAFPKVLMIYDEATLQQAIDTQQVALVIRFPQDFSRKIATGQPAQIQALIDGRRSNSAQIAFSYAQDIVQSYAQEVSPQKPLATLAVRYAYNPNLEYQWFVLSSLVAILSTVGALIVTALSLAREREEGTFDQLLVTPLTTGYIMIGKIIPGILVGMGQGLVGALCAVVFYQVPMTGNWLLLVLAMFCYALALVGVGLFISSFCATQQQAFLGVFCFMVPSITLSGFFAPTDNMPPILYAISQCNPLTYFIQASQGIFLKYFTFAQVWPLLWPMVLISGVTLSAAYALFYRKTAT